jgi:serine protease
MRHRIPTGVLAAATATAAMVAFAAPSHAASSTTSHKAAAVATAHHHAASPAYSGSGLLSYGGGKIVTSPTVYIVYWGSQWGTGSTVTSDPSGEAALQLSFFQHAYGSGDTYFTSQTQYCEGVATGTTQCGSSGTHVGHPSSNPVRGTWLDSASAAPSRPSDSQLAAEAKRAAAHFGVSGDNIQIIVDSPHGVVPNGFKTQYCAWHDVTSSSSGADVPYTNFPYITDAGSGCGANFVSASNGVSGSKEGITIVGGHEYAETLTDPQAGSGWLDASGYETGDKCAWISSGQGASTIISMNGASFAVQSLWSNNYGGGAGNCVSFYSSATNQH